MILEKRPDIQVRKFERLSGGDIHRVFRLHTNDKSLIAKFHPAPESGLFSSEARSLETLAAAGLSVPHVETFTEKLLLLQDINLLKSQPDVVAATQLANMHLRQFDWQSLPEGLLFETWLGRFRQPVDYGDSPDWSGFYLNRRILPLLNLCRQGARNQIDSLLERWPLFCERVTPLLQTPKVCLLHGDLWNGNLYRGHFIDPAAGFGVAEMELAMMALFGGFSQAFWQKYFDVHPLNRSGLYEDRIRLYQLYHQLNHWWMFGSSYSGGVIRTFDRYCS